MNKIVPKKDLAYWWVEFKLLFISKKKKREIKEFIDKLTKNACGL